MLSMYWFVIIILVSFGIFSMVYIFYSAPYEVRDMETEILSSKIADCFSRTGRINPGIIQEDGFNGNFNLIRDCSLNFEVEDEYDWKQEGQFFAEVEFYNADSLAVPLGVISEGNLNWKTNCDIRDKRDREFEKLVKCREERVYALGEDSQQYLIKIIVGVAKIEKNARQ